VIARGIMAAGREVTRPGLNVYCAGKAASRACTEVKVKMILAVMIMSFLLPAVSACSGDRRDLPAYVGLQNTSGAAYRLWLGDPEDNAPGMIIEAGGIFYYTLFLKAVAVSESDSGETILSLDDSVIANAARDGSKTVSSRVRLSMPYKEGMRVMISWDGICFTAE